MLDRIEALAEISVARGCGFAGLAIGTTMIGFAGEYIYAMKVGGLLALLTSAILQIKAWHAPTRNYKSTELWLMLKPQDRPVPAIAQKVIGSVLREVYLLFAIRAAAVAAGLLASATIMSLYF
jgi:hypothetical protein